VLKELRQGGGYGIQPPPPKCWEFFHVTNHQNHTYCCHRASANIAYKRLKDVATRCVLRAVNASKCVCIRGSPPDPAGGADSGLQIPSWILGEGVGKGGERKGERNAEGREKEGKGR